MRRYHVVLLFCTVPTHYLNWSYSCMFLFMHILNNDLDCLQMQWIVLNVYRTYHTRIVTGMSSASSAQRVAALWWKSPLLPKMNICCATNATLMITPPSATPARKPSCQVYRGDDDDDDDKWGCSVIFKIIRHIYLISLFVAFILTLFPSSKIYFHYQL